MKLNERDSEWWSTCYLATIISPKDISDETIYLLNEKDSLMEQKINLLKIRGKKGAVKKLSNLILETIAN